jgi:hypothetical protein
MILSEALRINNSVALLDLCNCELDTTSVIALADLMCNHTSIQDLLLDNPRLHSRQDETTKCVAQMLQQNVSLRKLSLRKHRVQDAGAKLIAESLHANLSLVCLDVSW